MPQHDYALDNAPGSSFRADLNNALQAILTMNSGPAAPAAPGPFMLWADTTAGLIRQRNAANTAWVTLAPIGQTLVPTTSRQLAAVFCNFSAASLTGTYTRTGTLVTVTMTAHGMTTGQLAFLDFTTGTATDGSYTVTVVDANTFTVTDTVSGATSGNVTRLIWVRSHFNVTSVVRNSLGDYTVNFNALPDALYTYQVSGRRNNAAGRVIAASIPNSAAYNPTATSFRFTTFVEAAAALEDPLDVCVTIFD